MAQNNTSDLRGRQEAPRTVKSGERAVTIGASMGGLLAARVLADYYEQVRLLERDTLPPPGENRKVVLRVLQGNLGV